MAPPVTAAPRRRPRRLPALALVVACFGYITAACDTFGLDKVGVGLADDGTTVEVFIQPCRSDEFTRSVSVFVPRPNLEVGWEWDTVVARLLWEITTPGDSTVRTFEVGIVPAPFSQTVALAGPLPGGELWAFTEYRVGNSSHRWRDKQRFQLDALRPGLVFADGRLVSPEDFFARDTCNPPKDSGLGVVGSFIAGGIVVVVIASVPLTVIWERRRASRRRDAANGRPASPPPQAPPRPPVV